MIWVILFSATIQRAVVGVTKSIVWNMTDIPSYHYDIKNMDKNQTYVTVNWKDVKITSNAIRLFTYSHTNVKIDATGYNLLISSIL